MFEIKEAVQPKKEIRDKKSLSAGNGISNIYIERDITKTSGYFRTLQSSLEINRMLITRLICIQ